MSPSAVPAGRNPLLRETLGGLGDAGQANLDYLLYLFLQAVVLFVWWPKDTLWETLSTSQPPDTLLASVLAAGAAVSWFTARAGAEEVLLPGQNGLRDWAAATPLPLGRMLRGYLLAHLVQTVWLLLLSLPLVLCAFPVSGARWQGLVPSLLVIVFMATAFRLAGACIYLAIGRHRVTTLVCVRAVVLLTYVLTAVAVAPASHLRLAGALLGDGADPGWDPTLSTALFMGIHTAVCVALLVVLHRQLAALRRAAREGTAAAGP